MRLDVTNSRVLDASVDRVWTVMVDEFTEVGRFISGLDGSGPNPAATDVLPGAPAGGRVCVIPGLGETDERITRLDRANGVIAYSVAAEKIPGFVEGMENVWTIEAIDHGRTRLTQVLQAELRGVLGSVMRPMLKLQFGKLLREGFDDIAHYVETGSVSPKKAKELAKAGR